MQGIGLGEQHHVSGAEFPGKAGRRSTIALGQAGAVEEAADQPGGLLARVAGGALQIAQHHPLIGPAQPAIGKTLEHGSDEAIALCVVIAGLKLDVEGAIEKGA